MNTISCQRDEHKSLHQAIDAMSLQGLRLKFFLSTLHLRRFSWKYHGFNLASPACKHNVFTRSLDAALALRPPGAGEGRMDVGGGACPPAYCQVRVGAAPSITGCPTKQPRRAEHTSPRARGGGEGGGWRLACCCAREVGWGRQPTLA